MGKVLLHSGHASAFRWVSGWLIVRHWDIGLILQALLMTFMLHIRQGQVKPSHLLLRVGEWDHDFLSSARLTSDVTRCSFDEPSIQIGDMHINSSADKPTLHRWPLDFILEMDFAIWAYYTHWILGTYKCCTTCQHPHAFCHFSQTELCPNFSLVILIVLSRSEFSGFQKHLPLLRNW